jgi:hypothetical protein
MRITLYVVYTLLFLVIVLAASAAVASATGAIDFDFVAFACKANGYQRVIYVEGKPFCYRFVEVTQEEAEAFMSRFQQ